MPNTAAHTTTSRAACTECTSFARSRYSTPVAAGRSPGFDAVLAGFHVHTTAQYDVPGTTIVEATVTATHGAEYYGIPASGLPVVVELVGIFVVGEGENAGKIVCERAYFDNETLLRQMRGEVGAPTGVGLAGRG